MSGNRDTYWAEAGHYERRWKGQTYGGLEFNDELAGPGGMHFHFWVPQGGNHTAKLVAAVKECKAARDMVSWSWDFIPAEG